MGARWLHSLLGGPIPTERRATCSDCAMTAPDPFPGASPFDPETKCCTFFPNLASFQVGGLLSDDDPSVASGRATVAARIAEGLNTTPFGVGRPAIFTEIYTPGSSFGQAKALRCPYYIEDGGLCGIWRHRESTCATWFCKHERGRIGFDFWRATRLLFQAVEQRLAFVLAEELGVDREALLALERAPFQLCRDEDAGHYAAMWGPWAGREHEYFVETARRAEPLAWTDVRARCGEVLDEPAREFEAALAFLRNDQPLPEFTRVVMHEPISASGTRVRLRTYSEYDPLDLPAKVSAALPLLDDRPVAEVPEIDAELLRRLIDYGVVEG